MNVICINNHSVRLTIGKSYDVIPYEYGISPSDDMYKYHVELGEVDHRPGHSEKGSMAGRTIAVTDDSGYNTTFGGGRFKDIQEHRENQLNKILSE